MVFYHGNIELVEISANRICSEELPGWMLASVCMENQQAFIQLHVGRSYCLSEKYA